MAKPKPAPKGKRKPRKAPGAPKPRFGVSARIARDFKKKTIDIWHDAFMEAQKINARLFEGKIKPEEIRKLKEKQRNVLREAEAEIAKLEIDVALNSIGVKDKAARQEIEELVSPFLPLWRLKPSQVESWRKNRAVLKKKLGGHYEEFIDFMKRLEARVAKLK